MIPVRKLALMIAPMAMFLVTPAQAETAASTRLVSCGEDSCLLVSGHRDHSQAAVYINGHAVPVEGKRNWQVRLPVSIVRDWSVPFARKIEVSYHQGDQQIGSAIGAKLPIGLLGHVPDLASLVITLNQAQ